MNLWTWRVKFGTEINEQVPTYSADTMFVVVQYEGCVMVLNFEGICHKFQDTKPLVSRRAEILMLRMLNQQSVGKNCL